jgi:hypothetical protein
LEHPSSKIRALGLGSNDITQRALAELSPAVGRHPTLQELLLNNNPIGDDGADFLFKNLRDNNQLTALNLGGCSLKKCRWGAKLSVMLSLRDLVLSQNMIDDDGFQALSDGLLGCVCLRHIDISYNRFGGEICKMIGAVLGVNKGLLSLNLSGNEMHAEVWKALAFALAENNTLNTLDLRWCSLNQHQAQHFCSSLCDNQTCTVHMDYNPVSYHIRDDPRTWDPVEHAHSMGSDTTGLFMRRTPNAPSLRELRKKARAAIARQTATGKTGHEEASTAMEELEKAKDGRSVNVSETLYENPIKRSDELSSDDRIIGRKPKQLLLNSTADTLKTVESWRAQQISLINDQRAVVDLMGTRAKRRAKHLGLARKEDTDMDKDKAAPPARAAGGRKGVGRPAPPPVDDDDASSVRHGQRGDTDTVVSTTTLATAADERSLQSGITIHLAPALGAMKVRRAQEEKNIRKEEDAGRKRILQVTYGNRLILLGGIEVELSTTYEQARELVMPMLRKYLASAERTGDTPRQVLRRLLTEFKFLDNKGIAVAGNETHIRTVWSELSQSGYYLDIQPAAHLDVPLTTGFVDGDADSDEDLDDDEDGDRPSGVNAYD